MKKFILLLPIIALFCQSTFAQTGGLNFQGVARNATGAVLANQKINLKFSILKTTETGTVEYTETKEATTNAQGIFAVVVGEINATSFAAVDWKVTPKFLKVEMDAAGGTSFITMGTTRLQNVPFAYYANGVNANNIDGAVPVSKGGTGATDASTARTNLGLVIGTNVQAPLTAGTDYMTPTGNAATASKLATAKKINGIDFDGTSDITITTTADASTFSGTIAVANGGTGLNTFGTNGQVLTTTVSGTLTWTTPAATISNISVGLNLDLGGYVIYVTPNGKHGLVVPLQDQADFNHMVDGNMSQTIVSDPNNYDSNGKNFTDWRVPTKYELGLINLKRNEIGGFSILNSTIDGYWSSTEYTPSLSDGRNFYLGLFADIANSNFTARTRRTSTGMVRAIRSF